MALKNKQPSALAGVPAYLVLFNLHNDSNSSFSFEESFWLEIKRQNDFI
jgi:hypothetical protein